MSNQKNRLCHVIKNTGESKFFARRRIQPSGVRARKISDEPGPGLGYHGEVVLKVVVLHALDHLFHRGSIISLCDNFIN